VLKAFDFIFLLSLFKKGEQNRFWFLLAFFHEVSAKQGSKAR
jgi:hypothetical protein